MAEPLESKLPTDVQVLGTDYSEIVLWFPQEIRALIGRVALSNSRWFRPGSGKLISEIDSGQTIVVETGVGEIERVAKVVALRIERADGFVLVCLGRINLTDLERVTSGRSASSAQQSLLVRFEMSSVRF